MEKLQLESLECVLTTGCNLSCSYCHQGGPRPGFMPWEDLRRGIDRLLLSKGGKKTLAFTGGEALLAWPLIRRAVEYVSGAEPCGIRFSLTTNGVLLDGEKLRFLVAHQFEVQLSLDGIREAQELRAPGTFARLDLLLHEMKRKHRSWMRKKLSVGMVLSSENLSFLCRSVEYLLNRGVESIRLAPLLTHDAGWGPEAEAELRTQAEKLFALCLSHYEKIGAIPLELFRHGTVRRPPKPERPVCRVRSPDALAMGVDGSLSNCLLLLPQEVGGTHRSGMLDQWISREDWPGLRRERYSAFRKCRDCEFLDDCLVCPVASANIPGNTDLRRVPEFNCAFNRIFGRLRENFPPISGALDCLLARDPLPAAMKELAVALGDPVSGLNSPG